LLATRYCLLVARCSLGDIRRAPPGVGLKPGT